LYVQASSFNIKEITKIKENFLNLLSKKIEKVHKIINKPRKEKSRFNKTTKRLLRRQVLVFFLNQQFIIQGIRADHGSYFVTTYKKTQTTWGRKREREKKRKETNKNEKKRKEKN